MIERDTHHQFHRNTFQKISPQKFHNFIFYPTFSSISCTLIPSPSLNIYIFFNLFFFHGKHLLSFPNTYLSNPPSHSSILSQKIQGNKIIKSPLTPPPLFPMYKKLTPPTLWLIPKNSAIIKCHSNQPTLIRPAMSHPAFALKAWDLRFKNRIFKIQ